jgi:hypothetical protein
LYLSLSNDIAAVFPSLYPRSPRSLLRLYRAALHVDHVYAFVAEQMVYVAWSADAALVEAIKGGQPGWRGSSLTRTMD